MSDIHKKLLATGGIIVLVAFFVFALSTALGVVFYTLKFGLSVIVIIMGAFALVEWFFWSVGYWFKQFEQRKEHKLEQYAAKETSKWVDEQVLKDVYEQVQKLNNKKGE